MANSITTTSRWKNDKDRKSTLNQRINRKGNLAYTFNQGSKEDKKFISDKKYNPNPELSTYGKKLDNRYSKEHTKKQNRKQEEALNSLHK